jgi:peptidoglycan/LPS O-acetylase OafA/YrhL
MIFFVISGYAISYKPLDLARKGRWADFNSALASSVFRRHSRLFIPAATVSFFTALATYLGWFGTEGWGDVAVASRQPPRPGAFLPQLYDWAAHTIEMVDPFSRNDNRGMSNFYDPNLWTLPIEFDFSMVVFLCLAAFSRLRPLVRLIMTFGLLCYANYYTHWRVFLFISGMFLCDLKFYLAENEPTSSLPEHTGDITEDQTPTHTKNTTLIKAAWTVSFILTIYLLSMPEIGRGGRDSPGYKTLAAMIPSQYAGSPDHFWIPLGSAWLVFTIDRASHLQAIFTHRFPQYLGRISYSLYLVHGPLLWTLGRAAAVSAVGLTGRSTNELYCFGIFLSACVFWPVTIWVADIVMRAVDLKAVAFGHWAYASLLRDTNEGN